VTCAISVKEYLKEKSSVETYILNALTVTVFAYSNLENIESFKRIFFERENSLHRKIRTPM